jgi:hypothetical protein
MRILLVIVLVLTTLLALWCAAGYFGAPVQQLETRAELSQSQASRGLCLMPTLPFMFRV